jgi:hypothetical protein
MTASFLSPSALLQAAAPGASLTPFLFQLAAISAIIYGGIVGEVVHMKDPASTDKSMDDHLTIKSGESRLIIERGRIAKVLGDKVSVSPNA